MCIAEVMESLFSPRHIKAASVGISHNPLVYLGNKDCINKSRPHWSLNT